ncbi:Hypothetical protein, putative [Bodo saltans]|uniref:Uncharacterized protein n=1 Tax=Bodo saltans TaxID=75058 RepID=A0A0S4JFB9_BODSA|nr:Hypothetical protein, putative [Bodo saltans]|eukprot:CUG88133.1 Hypothetical protein, putative [Bodo saltans]
MFSAVNKDFNPGPGAYDPKWPTSGRQMTIQPIPPPPELPDAQDKEAVVAYEKKKKFMEDLWDSKRRHPEFGAYSPRGTFGGDTSPRSRAPDKLFGTPRNERTVFNVDLYDVSKRPGPGQYNLTYKGVGGRDRLYRKKLPIETINYMAPTLPPISPRR